MSRNVVVVPGEATLVEAAELMKNHEIGFLARCLVEWCWLEF
jgi:CBS domain-containing protein